VAPVGGDADQDAFARVVDLGHELAVLPDAGVACRPTLPVPGNNQKDVFMRSRLLGLAAAGGLLLAGIVVPAQADAATKVPVYKNCTAMHAKYKHGVGRQGAHDKVTSGKPVTNFYVSTTIYNANKKLDRDHDGVACEQH
jgi:Excalibur calcium-binding domain